MRRVQGVDVARVEAAVRAAETGTTGEIRVALARLYFWGDVQRAAARAFRRLRMDRTRERNGVLIFVAPRRRALAVLGDAGIAARVGPAFWRDTVDVAIKGLAAGNDLSTGIVATVAEVGRALAAHFPGAGDNRIPDSVVQESGR